MYEFHIIILRGFGSGKFPTHFKYYLFTDYGDYKPGKKRQRRPPKKGATFHVSPTESESYTPDNRRKLRVRKTRNTLSGPSTESENYTRLKNKTHTRRKQRERLHVSSTDSDIEIPVINTRSRPPKKGTTLNVSSTDSEHYTVGKKRRRMARTQSTCVQKYNLEKNIYKGTSKEMTQMECTHTHSANPSGRKNTRRTAVVTLKPVQGSNPECTHYTRPKKARRKPSKLFNKLHALCTDSDSEIPANKKGRKRRSSSNRERNKKKKKRCNKVYKVVPRTSSSENELVSSHSPRTSSTNDQRLEPEFTDSDIDRAPNKTGRMGCETVSKGHGACTPSYYEIGPTNSDGVKDNVPNATSNMSTIKVQKGIVPYTDSESDSVSNEKTHTPVIAYYTYNCDHSKGMMHCNMAPKLHEVIFIDSDLEEPIQKKHSTHFVNSIKDEEVRERQMESESHPQHQPSIPQIHHEVILIESDLETEDCTKLETIHNTNEVSPHSNNLSSNNSHLERSMWLHNEEENHDVIVIQPMSITMYEYDMELVSPKMETLNATNFVPDKEWESQAETLLTKLLSPQRLQFDSVENCDILSECMGENTQTLCTTLNETTSSPTETMPVKEQSGNSQTIATCEEHNVDKNNSQVLLPEVNTTTSKNISKRTVSQEQNTIPCEKETLNVVGVASEKEPSHTSNIEENSMDTTIASDTYFTAEETFPNEINSSIMEEGGVTNGVPNEMGDNGPVIKGEMSFSSQILFFKCLFEHYNHIDHMFG